VPATPSSGAPVSIARAKAVDQFVTGLEEGLSPHDETSMFEFDGVEGIGASCTWG
jgi:hypothetical protein